MKVVSLLLCCLFLVGCSPVEMRTEEDIINIIGHALDKGNPKSVIGAYGYSKEIKIYDLGNTERYYEYCLNGREAIFDRIQAIYDYLEVEEREIKTKIRLQKRKSSINQ